MGKVVDLIQHPGPERVRSAERAANEVLRRSVGPGLRLSAPADEIPCLAALLTDSHDRHRLVGRQRKPMVLDTVGATVETTVASQFSATVSEGISERVG